ncbi:MAG: BamA/TamA family outer membrane protein [Muribaculaceae bacterium]|nr:BamA/TamA family outer membrane protein [Muribaculaceae bacterium]
MKILFTFLVSALLWSCSSTRHVPEGQLLLDNATITINENESEITSTQLINYLRQAPNHKVLGFAKLQLATYNMSGQDTTRWYNKWVRKLGQPPVIYDSTLTAQSARQLRQALINQGYNDVRVEIDTVARREKKKMDVHYNITTGQPHFISSISYEFEDSVVGNKVMEDSLLFTISEGTIFNRNNLETERTLITERLRKNGYYAFTKEDITFIADTAAGSKNVDLTMLIHRPRKTDGTSEAALFHQKYYIRNVYIITDYDSSDDALQSDTVNYKGINIVYGPDKYLRPSVLEEKCFILPGSLYNSANVNRTYESMSRLGILKFINITMQPAGNLGGDRLLDCVILLSRTKKMGASLELEGTNSEGDLGFGVGLTFQHRNLWKGSETLTTKFRTSYESLSGNLDGLINDRYTEYAGEIGITFPKFMAPFIPRHYKQRIIASSEVALSFNYQERPEYTRIISGAAWKYKWANRSNTMRRTFDLIDVNFVYLPHSTLNFIDEIAPTNPLLRYSYEDHLIMRMGYTYYLTNRKMTSADITNNRPQQNFFTLRYSIETAGNILYAISNIIGQKKSDGAYKVFGTQYSQYIKSEIEYTHTHYIDRRNSFAYRAGFGIGYPYGNSRMIPFEKRFYAGGANGVRGWGVRTLGPGSYDSRNSVTDFINQCGDISLDLSVEYRAKLFWVFEGALFIDAGNIWTIHNYVNQPGGMFKFNRFYKQIAAAYGAGLRMDFTYFVLRLDLGMKAHNPAMNQEPWPLIHPHWHRDATLHFAVGYPF